ncbi:MAG: hypothetical protein LBT48_03715 [Prevotellaceae bacterium]|jgi:hypothetical protein|nr:hypothetical protein [Prevotellaceae bacterium]
MNNTKKHFANDIVVFFKAMKVSVWIGLAVVGILFFLVYDGYNYINPKIGVREYGNGLEKRFLVSNAEVCYRAVNEYGGGLSGTPAGMESVIRHCCKAWLINKSLFSLLMGFVTFIGIPLLTFFWRVLSRSVQHSKTWIDENRTI